MSCAIVNKVEFDMTVMRGGGQWPGAPVVRELKWDQNRDANEQAGKQWAEVDTSYVTADCRLLLPGSAHGNSAGITHMQQTYISHVLHTGKRISLLQQANTRHSCIH